MIFLDHCATTPLDPEARQAMENAGPDADGNPSSVHGPGRKARALLREARARIAAPLGVLPDDLVFTASASEANNLALKGAALRDPHRPFRLIVSAFEHDSVRNAARYLAERFDWVELREVNPGREGVVEPDAVEAACAGGAALVSVMAVNNEIGTIQPVREIGEAAHRRGALFHVDAVQAMARLPTAPDEFGCDLMTLSSHKIYGPRGAGLLYVNSQPGAAGPQGLRLDPLIHGGHQEKLRRAGTENLRAILGFARAVELAVARREEDGARLDELERAFLDKLRDRGVEFALNGSPERKVAGVINLSLPGVESNDLVVGMDLAGYAISAGSACSSGVIEPSHVLRAMGLEDDRVRGGIRISFGRGNRREEAFNAADALADLYNRLAAEDSALIEEAP